MDTIEINSALPDGSHLFDADVHVLKEHLKSNQMSQEMLDGYLLSGFQLVQRQIREMRQVAPALKLLLQSGAKWQDDSVMENDMTPYHLICKATGDDDELLDMTIKSSEKNLLNNKSYDGSTALLYAVNNANLKCVKSLVAKGAEVNLEGSSCLKCSTNTYTIRTLNLITAANKLLQHDSIYPSGIMSDIFDLLLDSGIDINKPCCVPNCQRTPIRCATQIGNVQCVKKMIEKGACLDTIGNKLPVWSLIALMGSVELLQCLFDHAIDKNSRDSRERSVLSFVVESGKIEAVRYLLDLGVAMPSYTPATNTIPCKKCGKNRLLIDTAEDSYAIEPFMIACENMCNVVQLLDKYGNQNLQTMIALRCTVRHESVEIVRYLLSKYKYPLNDEYFLKKEFLGELKGYYLLEEACGYDPAVVQLLLDHGADINKTYCYTSGIINSAMASSFIEGTGMIALLIRNGADVNCRSYYSPYRTDVLPFENAVVNNKRYIAEMFLISGCCCGLFSLDNDHRLKNIIGPDLENLMKEWNVHENNVTPLKKQCRRVILKQLSSTAQKKIKKLPLPPPIIKYLSIPELNDIIDAKRNKIQMHSSKLTDIMDVDA